MYLAILFFSDYSSPTLLRIPRSLLVRGPPDASIKRGSRTCFQRELKYEERKRGREQPRI